MTRGRSAAGSNCVCATASPEPAIRVSAPSEAVPSNRIAHSRATLRHHREPRKEVRSAQIRSRTRHLHHGATDRAQRRLDAGITGESRCNLIRGYRSAADLDRQFPDGENTGHTVIVFRPPRAHRGDAQLMELIDEMVRFKNNIAVSRALAMVVAQDRARQHGVRARLAAGDPRHYGLFRAGQTLKRSARATSLQLPGIATRCCFISSITMERQQGAKERSHTKLGQPDISKSPGTARIGWLHGEIMVGIFPGSVSAPGYLA